MAPRKPGLNPKQLRFCVEYLKDQNGKQAAMRAGYPERAAAAQASRLLTNVNVAMEIEKRIGKIATKVEITKEEVLHAIKRVIHADPKDFVDADGNRRGLSDLPEEFRKALSVEVGPDGIKYKIDKNAQITNAAKIAKLMSDRVELGVDRKLEDLIEQSFNQGKKKDSE